LENIEKKKKRKEKETLPAVGSLEAVRAGLLPLSLAVGPS
jgi:hypothetical protein